jgi:hypothetical protein
VVASKHRYSLKPPSGGWPAISPEEFDAIITREEALLEEVLYGQIARRTLTHAMSRAVTLHRLWERVAALGLIEYGIQKW